MKGGVWSMDGLMVMMGLKRKGEGEGEGRGDVVYTYDFSDLLSR